MMSDEGGSKTNVGIKRNIFQYEDTTNLPTIKQAKPGDGLAYPQEKPAGYINPSVPTIKQKVPDREDDADVLYIGTTRNEMLKSFEDCDIYYSDASLDGKQEQSVSNTADEFQFSRSDRNQSSDEYHNADLVNTNAGPSGNYNDSNNFFQTQEEQSSVQEHQEIERVRPEYFCTSCSFKTMWKHRYLQHLRCHNKYGGKKSLTQRLNTNRSNYTCKICGYQCRNKKNMKTHRWRKHIMDHVPKARLYKNVASNSLQINLEKPGKIINDNCIERNPVQQTILAALFQNRVGPSSIARDNLPAIKQTQVAKTRKWLQCTLCNYTCIHKKKLQIHMTTHKENSFCCVQCNFTTNSEKYLNEHLITHAFIVTFNKKSIFFCKNCSYNCTSEKRFLNHVKIHTEEKFNCASCGFEGTSEKILQRHKRFDCQYL